MRKIILFFAFLILLPHFLFADRETDEKRKIQEESRQNLYTTEALPAIASLPSVSQPALEKALSPDEVYFQELLSRKYLLRWDVLRPLLILIGEDDPGLDQAGQITLLKEKGIIPEKLAALFSPDEPLRKGLASYLFCRALGIKGGVVMRLFGMHQRYAFNELVFLRIMQSGSQHDILSGREFVTLFTNAAEYLSARNETLRSKNIK